MLRNSLARRTSLPEVRSDMRQRAVEDDEAERGVLLLRLLLLAPKLHKAAAEHRRRGAGARAGHGLTCKQ